MNRRTKCFWGAIIVVVVGCGGSQGSPDDAGVEPDGGERTDAGGFDPSVTYPGEGDACEFSMFCGPLQICVDRQCARHERFTHEDLELGPPTRIPDELLRTSTLYAEHGQVIDEAMWGTTHSSGGPGPAGPTLILFTDDFAYHRCPIVIYGDGPPRVVVVEDLICSAVGLSPEGYILAGGVVRRSNADPTARRWLARWVLLDPHGNEVVRETYPESLLTAVSAAIGAEAVPFNMTSVLWHEGRFLFSASAGLEGILPDGIAADVPQRPSHAFFGAVARDGSMEHLPVGEQDVQAGSYGWLVRDDGGVHSILITYDDADGERRSRVELLTWSSGARRTLASGADRSAGVGRYSQPELNRWSLSVMDYEEPCTAGLFDRGQLVGTMPWRRDPCPSSTFFDSPYGSEYGPSATVGPVDGGHLALGWTALTAVADERHASPHTLALYTSRGDLVRAFEVLRIQPEQWTYVEAHMVSRFAKTTEWVGFERDVLISPTFWEMPISRSR